MRAYSASAEEALLARSLLKDWASKGFLTEAQYHHMEREAVCELRRTSIFLRLVLFLFTAIVAGAAVALFFLTFFPHSTWQSAGPLLLIFAVVSYAAAEYAVSRGLYRYGIEEALAVCSVALLCLGLSAVLSTTPGSRESEAAKFLTPAAGTIASLWIWYRFGLPYAFPGAMIFVLWLSGIWASSPSAQHLIVAAFYAAGLIGVALLRSRHRFTYLNQRYSIGEALLWLGIYLTLNLRLSSLDLQWRSWRGLISADGFSSTVYRSTWVLTLFIPCAALFRGLHRKDRAVIAAGGIIAVLTLVTTKPYFGWEWHTWDPILLGALLIGVALFLHRWLSGGPGGIRRGFTARRLSAKDKRWMNAASAAFGFTSPHAAALSPQTGTPDSLFGGGDSGGGGATSDF